MSVQVNERTEPSPANRGEPLIRVTALKKYFPITQGILIQHHVGDVHHKHEARLDAVAPTDRRIDHLCELNVIEQVANVAQTTIVQDAWTRGQELAEIGCLARLAANPARAHRGRWRRRRRRRHPWRSSPPPARSGAG